MGLDAEDPVGLIVEDQRDLARTLGGLGEKVVGEALHLATARAQAPIDIKQARMVLLLRKRALPPAEEADEVGAVAPRLHRPELDHTRRGERIVRGPVHGAVLLFHHAPEFGLTAIEIVVEGLEVRIARAGVAGLEGFGVGGLFEEAERVTVPGEHVVAPTEIVMVEVATDAHGVVADEPAG